MPCLDNERSSGLCLYEIVNPARENVKLLKRRTVHASSNECRNSSKHIRVNDAIKADEGISKTGIYASLVLLLAYLIFLTYRATSQGQSGQSEGISVWQLQDSGRLLEFIGGLASMAIYQFAFFIPIGFFTAMALSRNTERPRRLAAGLTALGVAGILTVSVCTVASGWPWSPAETVGLCIALCGCVFGTWVGRVWIRGWKARLWLLPKIALLILFMVLCCSVILSLLVERVPLSFDPLQVTSADKRELVQIARSQHPRTVREGQTQTLQLTERHINLLLAWGLSLHSKNRKAKVDLASNRISFCSSFDIPWGKEQTYYLNLVAEAGPEIKQGTISLNVAQCRIGSVPVPKWLIDVFSPVISSLISEDPRTRPFLAATREFMIGPDWIEVIYSRLSLPPEFREAVFGPSTASVEILAATRAQVDHLLSTVDQSTDIQTSFGFYIENAFSLARNRSMDGNAIIENRGAVFALGILLGHPRVEEFLGRVIADVDRMAARRFLRNIHLRGRSDWTRHFVVSAAIALLSDEVVSNAAGLLKEELDADAGGSGFSFADLLADRAGTTFAILATCDQESAREFQDRISGGFNVDDFFPPASDLPEGISDFEFQTKYEGVGGEVYNQIIEEIERRIASCAAYR